MVDQISILLDKGANRLWAFCPKDGEGQLIHVEAARRLVSKEENH